MKNLRFRYDKPLTKKQRLKVYGEALEYIQTNRTHGLCLLLVDLFYGVEHQIGNIRDVLKFSDVEYIRHSKIMFPEFGVYMKKVNTLCLTHDERIEFLESAIKDLSE